MIVTLWVCLFKRLQSLGSVIGSEADKCHFNHAVLQYRVKGDSVPQRPWCYI